jgi:hypothetical protein
MPENYNGKQSRLEEAAIIARDNTIPINKYNGEAQANSYTATHTRALSDKTSPIYGKGSGQFLDIDNYINVGGEWDVLGNQFNSIGSGRNPAFALNGSTWGYGPALMGMTNYQKPDTSANKGQVSF